ncbi:hypothetical protein BV25DRAFT_966635 [Artomyces pyxidatus]|uniref:Uncharacterized protein n=1 Tax=Artomyces pyxidatus TaxID=48021 RepID=A0ACB8SVG8_9AGAM|nr:hypothetical protein BV25DRAFT_966635 [Artomyces pyxidatus]
MPKRSGRTGWGACSLYLSCQEVVGGARHGAYARGCGFRVDSDSANIVLAVSVRRSRESQIPTIIVVSSNRVQAR